MAVRTRRLFGPVSVAAGGAPALYTVPADRTAIINRWHLRPAGTVAAGAAFTLYVGAPAGGTAVEVWLQPGPDGGREGYLVLHEGETLYAGNGTAVAITIAASGVLLLGDPA